MPETLQQVGVGFWGCFDGGIGVLRRFWVRKDVFLRAGSCVLAWKSRMSFGMAFAFVRWAADRAHAGDTPAGRGWVLGVF
jgi:hypothetical protein